MHLRIQQEAARLDSMRSWLTTRNGLSPWQPAILTRTTGYTRTEPTMDPSIISGLAAVLGSTVGAAASITTAWFTQRAQGKRDSVNSEIKRRESLYTEFIAECSKLAIDSLDRSIDKPATFIQVYALLNRIRLISSDAVLHAADETLREIIAQYFQPNLTIEQIIKAQLQLEHPDPLKPFSQACRQELLSLQRAAYP